MKKLFVLLLLVSSAKLFAQDGYKTPPKEIMDLILVKPTPNVSVDDKAEWMLFSQSNSYPSIEELARPELRIAGLRINPNNFAPSRQTFINDLWLKSLSSNKEFKIAGLPSPLMAGSISWSPNDKKIAFTHTTSDRVDLYVIDVAAQKAMKVNKQALKYDLGKLSMDR
jgi:dipeptidyl aminopeptidase/acylaminoacyl peptidase